MVCELLALEEEKERPCFSNLKSKEWTDSKYDKITKANQKRIGINSWDPLFTLNGSWMVSYLGEILSFSFFQHPQHPDPPLCHNLTTNSWVFHSSAKSEVCERIKQQKRNRLSGRWWTEMSNRRMVDWLVAIQCLGGSTCRKSWCSSNNNNNSNKHEVCKYLSFKKNTSTTIQFSKRNGSKWSPAKKCSVK